ncbi:hypothetical protein EJB05_32662, partial [Eragrostis curvula]
MQHQKMSTGSQLHRFFLSVSVGEMQIRRFLLSAILLLVVVVLVSSPETAAASRPVRRRYDSIFSFGDSFADTGNNPAVFAWYSVFDPVIRPPYGTTFFGRPTGRNCDGRLILDFIAERLGIPYVPPYLGPPFASPSPANNSVFRQGASFAVGAATTQFPLNNTSLSTQLQWFEALMPSLCRRTTQGTMNECREVLGRSLFFVGEFGVNDYHFSFPRKSVQEVRSYVPTVIRNITMAVERLISHGAKTLVVPGMIPSGCSPPILAKFPNAAPAEFDSRTGCLKELNELGFYHNALLQQSLEKLRGRYPSATIIYADFFSPVMEMVESPRKFGLRDDVLTVCCGGGGRNNFNGSVPCGDQKATTCSDPSASLYWDGVHFTEAANRHIAGSWLSNMMNSSDVSRDGAG